MNDTAAMKTVAEASTLATNERQTTVFIRKRPIFTDEVEAHEFDCVTCLPPAKTGVTDDKENAPHQQSSNKAAVVVHKARMHAGMIQQLIDHTEFRFDGVFNEKASNEEVYSQVYPLVNLAAGSPGKTAMVLMYGQTGSGKSFTINSLVRQAAADIFSLSNGSAVVSISLSCLELVGDACFDLLHHHPLANPEPSEDKQAKAPVQLLTDSQGQVKWHRITSLAVSSATELVALFDSACAARFVASTEMNDESSRSHSIFRVTFSRGSSDSSEGVAESVSNELLFVDLAGSEMSADSMHHDAERRKECKYINTSLMTLKECLHIRAASARSSTTAKPASSMLHVYRKNKLTLALKDALTDPEARSLVICTVSPTSRDTEHTISTLRHACVMDGQMASDESESRFLTGGVVTTEMIGTVKLGQVATNGSAAAAVKEEDPCAQDPEVQRIEAAMKAPGVTSTTLFGLKKQLALRKAAVKKSLATAADVN